MLINVLLERSALVSEQRTATLMVHADASVALVVTIDVDRNAVLLGRTPLLLPTPIDIDRSALRSATATAGATLQLALDRSRVSLLRAPLPAHVADGQLAPSSELTRLLCRACAAPLVDGAAWRRILPLPSPAWLEMTDLWHCRCGHAHVAHEASDQVHEDDHHHHDDDDGDAYECSNHAHAEARSHRPIRAQPDLLLVDTATLLVHSSCVLRDAVVVNRSVSVSHCFGLDVAPEDRGNAALECRACAAQLGFAVDTGLADLLDANDVRLFTRRVTAESQHGSVRRLLAASIECDVAEDVAFHVQQTQQRRFVVRRRDGVDDAKPAVLLLLVLNDDWLAHLMCIDASDSEPLDLTGQLRPHVKLAYSVCSADVESAIEIERWSTQLRAQTLYYDAAACDELRRVLLAFTAQMPAPMRVFGSQSVGALRRSNL